MSKSSKSPFDDRFFSQASRKLGQTRMPGVGLTFGQIVILNVLLAVLGLTGAVFGIRWVVLQLADPAPQQPTIEQPEVNP